ncbi:DNA-binding protein WhiA [Herbivorax sp. ANBcel31]|uniref:DNA-binding protein WhiA n=1 Tax=Herbivorax sp. ANBcel31 TaxID=3069754 RepID=UPI0027ADEDFB|nr:DNA-binding protein WhiA [Herbivorax sp. ANBcel31]MDQ2086137.1 DNA-binding protein WhiA [Herbivorax sp. ANBcel31]
MSFSSTVKNELCRITTDDRLCMLSELASVVRINGYVKAISHNEINLRITTENAALARKVFSLIKELYRVNAEMIIRRSKKLKKHVMYILILTYSKGLKKILEDINIVCHNKQPKYLTYIDLLKGKKHQKAYLRGAFLAAGSMSDPEKTYHLEIITQRMDVASELNDLISSFKLHSKVIKRKSNYVVYLKEGENIVDFLNIIGAHSALLELENVRILKGVRNNVNRIVNCETANLQKTVDASIRQVENIRYIKEKLGFAKLPENLQDIAVLRLKYSDASLKELGEMLTPSLGKSGVNHRLRKLDNIAEEIRDKKEEVKNG